MGRHKMSDAEVLARMEFGPTERCEEPSCTMRGVAFARCRGCGHALLLCGECLLLFTFAARRMAPGRTPCCGRWGSFTYCYTLHSALDLGRLI